MIDSPKPLARRRIAIEPGIYPDVPFDVYKAWDAWNPSTIKVMLGDSAKAMRHVIDNGRESTESMDLGRAEHCCVLEPVRVVDTYAVMPPYELDEDNATGKGERSTSKATKYYKSMRLAFEKKNPSKEIIEQADYERCISMRDSIFAHESAPQLLREAGRAEVSLVWNDPGTGLLCKGRIDWLSTKVVDLKTASDPRPWAFLTQVAKLFYHVSIAAYVEGLGVLGRAVESAHFITVGNRPWHDVIRYEIQESMLRHGRREWHTALQRTAWCIKNDSWPGFCDEPYPAELPTWAVPQDEADAVSVGGEAAFGKE